MMRGFTVAATAAMLGCLALPAMADDGAVFDGVSRSGTDTVYFWKAAGKAGGSATIQGANGQSVTFSTSQGSFAGLARANTPPAVPEGLDYPLGFFSYEITGVDPGAFITLTVSLPAGTNASDWVDCPGNTCYRVTKSTSTAPGNVQIANDTITMHIQDNAAGDDDSRQGIVSATVAPGKQKSEGGGALSLITLLPLFGAAIRRRATPATR